MKMMTIDRVAVGVVAGVKIAPTKPTRNRRLMPDPRFFIQVSDNLPSLRDCQNHCAVPECGAVSFFCGITRNTFQGRRVVRLSYTAYVPMALKEMEKLCMDCVSQFPDIQRIAAVHKTGDCPVGDTSVILAASSPHRASSLQAVEFLINELKARIPIWKQEVYEDDSTVWKENIEWKEGRQQRVMVRQPIDNATTTASS